MPRPGHGSATPAGRPATCRSSIRSVISLRRRRRQSRARSKARSPETVMPPWGTHELFNEQEIRDIVAFLKTLKSPAPFRTALDDPEKRPPTVEKRDNLDPLENPGMWAVDRAQVLWKQRTAVGF